MILWYIICILHCRPTTPNQIFFHHHMFDPLYPLLTPIALVSDNRRTVVHGYEFLFSLFVNVLLFLISHIWLKSWFLTLSIWPISLSMIFSRSIRVVANGSPSPFLRLSRAPLCTCAPHRLCPVLCRRALVVSVSWPLWVMLQWT